MVRGILKMEKIKHERSRITTYHKRKKCLLHKAWEFSTLCGVDTCVIINGPDKPEPEIWPKEPEKVLNIINRYKATSAEISRKTFQLHDFFLARKKKVENEIAQLRKEIRKAQYPSWHDMFNYYKENELTIFTNQLHVKIEYALNLINQKTRHLLSNVVQNSSLMTQNQNQNQNQLSLYNQTHYYLAQQQDVPYPLSHPYYPLNQNVIENSPIAMYGGGHMSNETQYPSLWKGEVQHNPYWFQGDMNCESETFPLMSYYNPGAIQTLPEMNYAPHMYVNPQVNGFQYLLDKENSTS